MADWYCHDTSGSILQESAAGGPDEDAMTVEEKLMADAERLAASIQV
jgi:hypothetical protein